MSDFVDKPWGCEIIWAKTAQYVGKMMYIKAGCRLSEQYHNVKTETMLVSKGLVRIIAKFADGEEVDRRFLPGDSIHIPPGTVHRLEAVVDSCVIEVSTPELDDVVRLSDDYGRSDEGQ